ncbi:MAG: preprotein translocase subunit TatA, partial [Lachnospiraceae bacterium]|nr:preprotein translocase subunit TatA [Lachnospiraceae bacterium]
NVGTATVTITGMGNYTGTKTANFKITEAQTKPVSINTATISGLSSEGYTYTGSAITPTITVTLDSKTLTEGTDYTVSYSNNTNVGTATVTITGTGNYTGTKTANFEIVAAQAEPVSISTATISGLSSEGYTYTGSAITPTITVTLDSKTLTEGTDYTVSYSNNVDVGVALVTVTGTGDYTETKRTSFKIVAASLENATISGLTSKTYTGSKITQTPTVKIGSKTLTEGTDYTVSTTNNTNVGTATVTITGKGDYTGTKTSTFKITAKAVTPTVTLAKNTYVYNGSVRTPSLTVKADGKTITANSAKAVYYKASYASGRKNVGKYSVQVTLKGNYSGTSKAVYFTINPKATSLSSVAAGSKKFTAKWSKQTAQTTGYQLQYATNSSFTQGKKTVKITSSSTTKKEIKKLSAKKKYYVRIRCYKTASGKTYYSDWSKTKTVTTKK